MMEIHTLPPISWRFGELASAPYNGLFFVSFRSSLAISRGNQRRDDLIYELTVRPKGVLIDIFYNLESSPEQSGFGFDLKKGKEMTVIVEPVSSAGAERTTASKDVQRTMQVVKDTTVAPINKYLYLRGQQE